MVNCYRSRMKAKSWRLCEAFAEGCGGSVSTGPVRPGEPAFFYGVSPDTRAGFEVIRRSGGEWFYADNAYFGRDRHFRVTRDRLQHTGKGEGDPVRLEELGIEFKPWRTTGNHILVCPPGEPFMRMTGQPLSAPEWRHRTLRALWEHTDRPIVIREKPLAGRPVERPLDVDLEDCWAVVTHLSNVAIEAVCAGVPAFVSGPSAALPVCSSDLSMIEEPRTDGDREAWAAVLAANQWTLDEMRDGTCWGHLNGGG